MKNYDGKPEMPDPYKGVSPMHRPDGTPNEALFVALGGTITDDGQPSPKEAVIASLNMLLHELAEQVDGIGIAEFKQAAAGMHSGDLIAYARRKGVSEEIVSSARARFLEIMADALREGMSWAELVEGIRP